MPSKYSIMVAAMVAFAEPSYPAPPPLFSFASLSTPGHTCSLPCGTHQGLTCWQPRSTFICCCCPAGNGTPYWDSAPESSVSGFRTHWLYDLGQSLLLCVLIPLLRHRQAAAHSPHMHQLCYCDPGGSPGSVHWKRLQVDMEESQLTVPRMWNIWGRS